VANNALSNKFLEEGSLASYQDTRLAEKRLIKEICEDSMDEVKKIVEEENSNSDL